MKKLAVLLAIAFLIISATVIYLVRSGVSIRSAPIIRPSIITRGEMNIAQGVILRLGPEFQSSQYIVWGVLPETLEYTKLLQMMKDEFERLHQKKVTVISNALQATEEQLRHCSQSCWLFVPRDQAHELNPNAFLEQKIRPLNKAYSTITIVPFSNIPEVPQSCIDQKRLDFECLKILAIHEADRKMKEKTERYFFMKKYLDRDFFLFIQEAPLATK